MVGFQGRQDRWAGAHWCTWTTAWFNRRLQSPVQSLEQHLLDVEEALQIFRRRQLYAKSSKCKFGRQELGFLGHRLSKDGVSVDPCKMQSVVEWATSTSCTEVRCFTGLANYYRRFVEPEGYAEMAAPLTALWQPNGALRMVRGRTGELRRY